MEKGKFLALMADEARSRLPELSAEAANVWASGALLGYLFAQNLSWATFHDFARLGAEPALLTKSILDSAE